MRIAVLVVALAGATLGGARVDVSGALYPRFRLDAGGSSFLLMGAEATVRAQVTSRTRDILTAAVQLAAGTAMPGWTRGFHFGEAYALVPLGLRRPTVRVGQAVIPFGLLADYDIHSQVIQTSYARTIGLRLDPGIGLLGTLGPADYQLWLSNGNGPYVMDNNNNKLMTMRIAPTFLLGNAELTVGLSGLAGQLPYWPIDSLARQPSGPRDYGMKYRLGIDNTTDWGPVTVRLEGVVGRDSAWSAPLAWGWYAELRWSFIPEIEALAKLDGWHPPDGSAGNAGAGLNLRLPGVAALELQLVGQIDYIRTGANDERIPSFVSQLAVSF